MAGFERMYYLGSEGGFMGADGLNTIVLEIREQARQQFAGLAIYIAQLKHLSDIPMRF